eukprot:UN30172
MKLEEQYCNPLDRPSVYSQPVWIIGIILVVVGSFGDFAGLALAAQSVVAPIGSITLVANIFFATGFLGEQLAKYDILGCFFIVTGSIISVMFASRSSPNLQANDLIKKFEEPPFFYTPHA